MILSACPHRRVEPWARLAAVAVLALLVWVVL